MDNIKKKDILMVLNNFLSQSDNELIKKIKEEKILYGKKKIDSSGKLTVGDILFSRGSQFDISVNIAGYDLIDSNVIIKNSKSFIEVTDDTELNMAA